MVEEILKERETQHGKFSVNSELAQRFKAVVRDFIEWQDLTSAEKEAIDNILQKVARYISGGGFEDTIIDIQGYAELMKGALNEKRGHL